MSSHFSRGFFFRLHCVNLCTACDRKQKRTYNILFTLFEEKGDEYNTVRSVSVSVHDIYSSAFYLALCFFVSVLSPLPSSRHHSVSLAERKKKSHSALQTRCPGTGGYGREERLTKTLKETQRTKKSRCHFALKHHGVAILYVTLVGCDNLAYFAQCS